MLKFLLGFAVAFVFVQSAGFCFVRLASMTSAQISPSISSKAGSQCLPSMLPLENAASLGIASPTAQQTGRMVVPQQRLNPAYDTINQFQTEASSNDNGVTATMNRIGTRVHSGNR